MDEEYNPAAQIPDVLWAPTVPQKLPAGQVYRSPPVQYDPIGHTEHADWPAEEYIAGHAPPDRPVTKNVTSPVDEENRVPMARKE